MTTKIFIDKLNKTITIEGQTLMLDFFITFSRFECALKTSNFSSGDADKVSANWDTFIASIRPTFKKDKNAQLSQAVDYLIQNPPRIQMIDNGQLGWRDRIYNPNDPDLAKSLRAPARSHWRPCRPKPFQGLRTSEGFAKCKTLRKASSAK